ncbi:hypothetical protein [Methylobacter sp. S3L5C]|uniref:hypothetical protein n=1 Tax=Methylobacter sp. S3L5C TaxID=2839024 RepID=UPI001FAE336C|nr:hypothetical protein [Methylobacter sp. S3L5C]UOA10616.1 hypothetical protein KKZ03_10520 [Methylobacter sp. S3L5C]
MSCFLQKFFCNNGGNILSTPSASASDMMKKVRDDVARLLNHAIKQPNISIKAEFLQKTVPLLCRDITDLNPVDHVELWNAYNHLSSLLAPVTSNSLEVDEELNIGRYGVNGKSKWGNLKRDLWVLVIWMFIFVLAVFATQGYSIMMSNNTDQLTVLISEYTKTVDEETLANPDNSGDPNKQPLRSILDKKQTLKTRIVLSVQRQCVLNKPADCDENEAAKLENNTRSEIFQSHADAILQSGKAIDLLLKSLILPLLLGFLGAIAFLTRNTLNQLNDYTFIPSWGGRNIMRVLLGGLLGVIGPWLYASGRVDEVGLGLSLFAFLLGYSVELAFTLFDKFIDYARDAIKPGGEKAKTDSVSTSVIADPAGARIEATAVKTDGTVEAEMVSIEQNLQKYRQHLLEIIGLEPVLQIAIPPDYFKYDCAPKIQMARNLLQQLDSAREKANSDATLLPKTVGAIAELSKAITGKNHPLAIVLRTAVQNFSTASTIDGSAHSEAMVITLFAGAVAAFAQGASVYERWLATIWAQPFTARLICGIDLTEQDVLESLKLTEIFKLAFKGQTDALAKRLLELAARNENSEDLAELIWRTPSLLTEQAIDLPTLFGSVEVFTEAWIEYRHSLVRYVLQKVDFPANKFSNDCSLLTVAETLATIDNLRQNKSSEKDLDILCHLSLELIRQAQLSSSFDALDLIRRTLAGSAS